MKRAVLACAMLAAWGAACSAGSSDTSFDRVDAGTGGPVPGETDASTDVQNTATPSRVSLVLVNGLVDAGKPALDAVRVCIAGKPHPLPDAVPMPMTNFPGIPRGTGVDLGAADTTVTLRVFRAIDLRTDAAWSARTSCDSWAGLADNTMLTLTNLLPGPNLAVLVDDPKGTNGIGAKTAALPAQYSGQKDTLQMVAADYSTFATGGEVVHVSVQGAAVGFGTAGMLSSAPYGFSTLGVTLDGAKIRFDRGATDGAAAFFEQTLGSVQFLADPTTTTATYFDQRTNYAFVLLGDASKPVTTDAKDLQFDGKGLHVVAIPYAAVTN